MQALKLWLAFSMVLLTMACDKEMPQPKLTECCCTQLLNEDSTACHCPPKTHYKVQTGCFEKNQLTYKVRLDQAICLEGIKGNIASNDTIGVWRFWPESSEFAVDMEISGQNVKTHSIGQQPTFNLHWLPDGRLEFSSWRLFFIDPGDCRRLRQRTTEQYGYADYYGISDVGNQRMDIRVVYYSAIKRTPLDTSYIQLFK